MKKNATLKDKGFFCSKTMLFIYVFSYLFIRTYTKGGQLCLLKIIAVNTALNQASSLCVSEQWTLAVLIISYSKLASILSGCWSENYFIGS